MEAFSIGLTIFEIVVSAAGAGRGGCGCSDALWREYFPDAGGGR